MTCSRAVESRRSRLRRVVIALAGALILSSTPLAPGPIATSATEMAPAGPLVKSLNQSETVETTNLTIGISKWKIKKKVSVSYDLARMAAVVGVDANTQRDKVHNRKWGSYWAATLWDGTGLSDYQDVKIGTATLAEAAKANMVVDLSWWYATAVHDAVTECDLDWGCEKFDPEFDQRTTLVMFKGSKTADVYGQFTVKVLEPGKTVSTELGRFQLGKPMKLDRGKKYRAAEEPALVFDPALLSGKSYQTEVYYTKGTAVRENWQSVNVAITAPPINRTVAVYVKNEPQTLHAALDSKNPIYKSAKKLVGTPSASCGATVTLALEGSGVAGTASGRRGLNLPLGAGRTGDLVPEPGHISIYTGSGAKAIHGDVFSHKTFEQNAPLRNTYYVERPFANLFRYR